MRGYKPNGTFTSKIKNPTLLFLVYNDIEIAAQPYAFSELSKVAKVASFQQVMGPGMVSDLQLSEGGLAA